MQVDLSDDEIRTLTIALRVWAEAPKPKPRPPAGMVWKDVGVLYEMLNKLVPDESAPVGSFDSYVIKKEELINAIYTYRGIRLISTPSNIGGVDLLHSLMRLESILRNKNLEELLK